MRSDEWNVSKVFLVYFLVVSRIKHGHDRRRKDHGTRLLCPNTKVWDRFIHRLFLDIALSRFLSVGVHPEFLSGSHVQTSPDVAPGSYDLMQYGDFSDKNVQKRTLGPNWQQALYTEQMAKIPHSSFKTIHDTRKEIERRIGPGTYPITDFLTEADRRPGCVRGALDQLSPRFPKEIFVSVAQRSFSLSWMTFL